MIKNKNVIFKFLLTLVFISIFTLNGKVDAVSQILGDVNLDGEIDISDALLVSRYAEGLTKLSKQALKNADVNLDGKVNKTDAKLISKKDAGYDIQFPYVLRYGDVNLDGKVDISDAQLLLQALRKKTNLSSQAKRNADVYKDGKIDMADAIMISRFDAGLLKKLHIVHNLEMLILMEQLTLQMHF